MAAPGYPTISRTPTTDYGAGWDSERVRTASANMSAAAVAVSGVPAITGAYICITDLIITSAANQWLTFTDSSATVILEVAVTANSTVQITPRGKLKLPTANSALYCQSSAAGNLSIFTLAHCEK